MDKLASCFLQHGAPSKSFKPSTTHQRPTSLLTPGPGRRSVSTVWCIPTHAATAVKGNSVDIATGRHTHPQGGDGAIMNGVGFDFERYLSANAKAVHDALDVAQSCLSRCPEHLSESMLYVFFAGGKRVRPVLGIATRELVGGDVAAAIPVACAAEMIHTVSLVHDDMPCMDDDALRGGRPSNHVAFGEPTALLNCDALLTFAFVHVARGSADLGFPADRALRSVAELGSATGVGGVTAGQVADKASESAPDVNLAALEHIHVHKTARLLEAAAVCGAVVGGGTDAEVDRVRRYAHAVGLLFQVVDNVLDVTRTPEQLGKTASKDMAAGKATYPRLIGVGGARAYADVLLAKAEA